MTVSDALTPDTMVEYATAARKGGARLEFVVDDSVLTPETAEKVAAATGEPDKNGMARKRSPYRDSYEDARLKYADATHDQECMNWSRYSPNGCGTRANPEWGAPGSPWRPGHQHAAALRKVGKDFLDDLWREATRLHEVPA